MRRLRKAALTAGFTYAHYAIAIVSGLVLVPLTLRYVGARAWGLWLASGELVGYVAMIDLGILGVLPWLVAEADGRRDRPALARLVGHGVMLASVIAVVYVLAASLLWMLLPSLLGLTSDDRAQIGPALAVLVAAAALSYPLRVFRAVLGGLQDVVFNGVLTWTQTVLSLGLTATLLVGGYGLFALAIGATVPALVVFIAAALRTLAIAPDIMTGWSRPALSELRPLVTNGVGTWLGGLGWQLLSASNAIVITLVGRPELVPVYSCTAKLASMSTQMAWVLPDSGLVGLAQLFGERRPRAQLAHVVVMMLRLQLLLAGAAACAILALNPAFATAWVGPEFFGGLVLSALLAAGVVVQSVVHGLITTAAVLGNRLRVGILALLHGAAQTALALLLGRRWGLEGIAVAALVAALVTAIPGGLRSLESSTALTGVALARQLLIPWIVRVVGLAAVAAGVSLFHRSLGFSWSVVLAVALSLLHIWHMRPLYAGLPVGHRVGDWLVRLKLMPAAQRVAAADSP